jgi:hypothetical protein
MERLLTQAAAARIPAGTKLSPSWSGLPG